MLGPDSSLGPMIAATIAPLVLAERRSRGGGRPGIDAGADRRRGDDPRGRREARVRRRPALEADPDRVHERTRPHDPRRPAAQAVRFLGRRRRADRRGARVRRGGRRRGDGGPRAGDRARQPARHPGAAASPAEAARGADRRRARDRRRGGVRSDRPWRVCRGPAARGVPTVHDPRRLDLGRAVADRWRARDRARRPRRHDLDRIGVRRPPGSPRTRQPGDDRHRRLERGGRVVPGVPGEHQRLAHRGRRAGGSEDPGDRPGRRRWRSCCCWWWHPACCGTCRNPRWPRS